MKDILKIKKGKEQKIMKDFVVTDYLYINEKKDSCFDKNEVYQISIFDETDIEKLRFAYSLLEKK